jgi:hypothetical protein
MADVGRWGNYSGWPLVSDSGPAVLERLLPATEAIKHVLEEGPEKGPVLDTIIIAQYQRMTHYGIAGFGTAAAYAKALGLKDDNKKLREATKEIYTGDEYMTKLAETAPKLATTPYRLKMLLKLWRSLRVTVVL